MRLDRVQPGVLVTRTFVGQTVIEKPIEKPVEKPEPIEPDPKQKK